MHFRLPHFVFAVFLGLGFATPASAKSEKWAGPDGKGFRGEPAAVVGPVAVFRTGPIRSKRVRLSDLSAGDCVRFHTALQALPRRATTWSAATSAITRDLKDAAMRVDQGELVKADMSTRPEPEFLILLFCSFNDGNSWGMLDTVHPHYGALKKKHGDLVEIIFIGRGHNAGQHRDMAVNKSIPWLVADFRSQPSMSHIADFTPGTVPAIAIVTRCGALISGASGGKQEAYTQLLTDFSTLLDLADPNRVANWADRLHYQRAIQLAIHKEDTCPPELLGHPLDLETLRKLGIERIEARLEIAADGKVDAVEVATTAGVTADLAALLGPALAKSAFVPAVDHGRFVAGSCTVSLDVVP